MLRGSPCILHNNAGRAGGSMQRTSEPEGPSPRCLQLPTCTVLGLSLRTPLGLIKLQRLIRILSLSLPLLLKRSATKPRCPSEIVVSKMNFVSSQLNSLATTIIVPCLIYSYVQLIELQKNLSERLMCKVCWENDVSMVPFTTLLLVSCSWDATTRLKLMKTNTKGHTLVLNCRYLCRVDMHVCAWRVGRKWPSVHCAAPPSLSESRPIFNSRAGLAQFLKRFCIVLHRFAS